MAPAPEKPMLKFVLMSQDHKEFPMTEDVAFQSNLIKKMVEDLGIDDPESPMLKEPLPVSNVDAWTLEKIIEYCMKNRGTVYRVKTENECQRVDLTTWDNQWMEVDSEQLLTMLNAANYLDIPGAVDLITQKIANMANGKTVEELRAIFGLENDFTTEEEEELRKRFEWIEN